MKNNFQNLHFQLNYYFFDVQIKLNLSLNINAILLSNLLRALSFFVTKITSQI